MNHLNNKCVCSITIRKVFKQKGLLQKEKSHERWGENCICLNTIKNPSKAN